MALTIEIKVFPSSGQQKIILDKAGVIKCYLKKPAQKGMANLELIKFLAKLLGILQSDIEIIRGFNTRNKIIKINKDFSYSQMLEKFNIDHQLQIK